jgi:hypothetical protein
MILVQHPLTLDMQVCRKKCAILQENVLHVKLNWYNQTYLHPKLKGYGDDDKVSFKEWHRLNIYRLPNTYKNEEESEIFPLLGSYIVLIGC